MVKDHSDSEKGNPLPPHRLLLSINSKFFYMHHPTDRITHTTAFVTPVMEHWLERAKGVQGHVKNIVYCLFIEVKHINCMICDFSPCFFG